MKIVHVITRLILGGAQENTLLTVEGLHHRHRDDVTLVTGPADLYDLDVPTVAGLHLQHRAIDEARHLVLRSIQRAGRRLRRRINAARGGP